LESSFFGIFLFTLFADSLFRRCFHGDKGS
jgi:hypothetical protein